MLALTPLLTHAKVGIKYLNGFDMHLIPVKGMQVKRDNNFESTFLKLIYYSYGYKPIGQVHVSWYPMKISIKITPVS